MGAVRRRRRWLHHERGNGELMVVVVYLLLVPIVGCSQFLAAAFCGYQFLRENSPLFVDRVFVLRKLASFVGRVQAVLAALWLAVACSAFVAHLFFEHVISLGV